MTPDSLVERSKVRKSPRFELNITIDPPGRKVARSKGRKGPGFESNMTPDPLVERSKDRKVETPNSSNSKVVPFDFYQI